MNQHLHSLPTTQLCQFGLVNDLIIKSAHLEDTLKEWHTILVAMQVLGDNPHASSGFQWCTDLSIDEMGISDLAI